MKKTKWIGGVLIIVLFALGWMRIAGEPFTYESPIEEVKSIDVEAELANVTLTAEPSGMYVKFQGSKTVLGDPDIRITYKQDKAAVTVRLFKKNWMKLVPGYRQRGNLIVNIPPHTAQDIRLKTDNGHITADRVLHVSRLSLFSDAGKIRINKFEGGLLTAGSKNGSVYAGEVNGQIHIRNKVASIKKLDLKKLTGENIITVSNGQVNVLLPPKAGQDDTGLHIVTKNGKIVPHHKEFPVVRKGAGSEIHFPAPGGKDQLNITVSVGDIHLY